MPLVSEAMQLLSGLPPGAPDSKGRYPQKSFDYRVQQRIERLQRTQKKFMQRAPSEAENANRNGEGA